MWKGARPSPHADEGTRRVVKSDRIGMGGACRAGKATLIKCKCSADGVALIIGKGVEWQPGEYHAAELWKGSDARGLRIIGGGIIDGSGAGFVNLVKESQRVIQT